MPPSTLLVKGGYIVTMDAELGDIAQGDILIEDGKIVRVGKEEDIEVDDVIDASGMIVLPGFLDGHTHLWQSVLRGMADDVWASEYKPVVHPMSGHYRPSDMFVATKAGALQALNNGTTTILDFCHSVNSPEHADASVEALQAVGIRALYGYCFLDRPDVEKPVFKTHKERLDDARRVAALLSASDDRVQMAIALNNLREATIEMVDSEIECARDLDALITLHSHHESEIDELDQRGKLGSDIVWAHQESAGPEQLRKLADSGGSIAATPEVEVGVAGRVPVTGRAVRHGVPVMLGIDIPSGVPINMLSQMRITYRIERFLDAQRERHDGRTPVRNQRHPTMTARDVLRLATIDGARCLGLDQKVGSLVPGKEADLIAINTAPFGRTLGDVAGHVVLHADAGDVDSVIVGGHPVKRGGVLQNVPQEFAHEVRETQTYLLDRRQADG